MGGGVLYERQTGLKKHIENTLKALQREVLDRMNEVACVHRHAPAPGRYREDIYIRGPHGIWRRSTMEELEGLFLWTPVPNLNDLLSPSDHQRWTIRRAHLWWYEHPGRRNVDRVVDDKWLPRGIIKKVFPSRSVGYTLNLSP